MPNKIVALLTDYILASSPLQIKLPSRSDCGICLKKAHEVLIVNIGLVLLVNVQQQILGLDVLIAYLFGMLKTAQLALIEKIDHESNRYVFYVKLQQPKFTPK